MIPKSLHTVTALAKLGAYLLESEPRKYSRAWTTTQKPTALIVAKGAVLDAAIILGYAHHSDDYGLIDKAAAVIAKGAK